MKRLRRKRLERDFDDDSDMDYLSEDDNQSKGNGYLENDDRLQSDNQSGTNDWSEDDAQSGSDSERESYDESETDIT